MTAAAILELIGGIRAALFLSLAIVFGAGWGIQTHRLGNAQDDLAAADERARVAVASNATLRQTIGTLQAANAEWARKNAADLAAADLAVAAVARERDALRIERDKRRAERETVYAHDPSAAAWGRTVVPRGIADLL